MKHTRTVLLPAAALVTALLLTACGSDNGHDDGAHGGGDTTSTENAAPDAEHNAADVAFAQDMIPHHQQAVEMSQLAADRAESAEVLELAEEIEGAQAPEITLMTGWLQEWDEDLPGEDDGHGDDHSAAMPGMLSDAQMAELADASGPAFDTRFLELMIEHHEGAIEMSRTQLAEGSYGPATELAEEIIAAQQAEIDRMNVLLGND
jgi:uncharacterized protein (DUF305 family)